MWSAHGGTKGDDVQLPAHSTGAGWWRDVRGYRDSLEVPMALRHSFTKSHALGTGADGVGRVLDVGAGDVVAKLGEQHGADTELAIRAVCRRLGCHGLALEMAYLLCGQAKGLTRLLKVLVVGAGEERRGCHLGSESTRRLGWMAKSLQPEPCEEKEQTVAKDNNGSRKNGGGSVLVLGWMEDRGGLKRQERLESLALATLAESGACRGNALPGISPFSPSVRVDMEGAKGGIVLLLPPDPPILVTLHTITQVAGG